jgi:AraC-type DNA-binding domain-containing proteins
MTTAIAHQPLESIAPRSAAPTRAWRPFPRDVADVLCIEESAATVRPRMHARFALMLVHSPAVVRAESSRSVVADRSSILLVPAWQLHALRAMTDAHHNVVTLLLGASHVAGLGVVDRPVLVTDTELGAQMTALVAQLRRPLQPIDCVVTIRPMLERLAAHGTPTAVSRVERAATPLGPIRDYLRAHLAEPITTARLAHLSGLTEWHLIRAFHREFGLPPHAYHMRLRLAAASELLMDGLGVSTAAYECGFADQSHLSRKFKEVYALTPAAWAAAAVERAPRRSASPSALRPVARRGAPASLMRHSHAIAPPVRRGDDDDYR